MKKSTAHYDLQGIQAQVAAEGAGSFTRTALDGLAMMNLDLTEGMAVITALSRKDLDHSMTSYSDHRVWQDVYRAPTSRGDAYVKFTLLPSGAIVINFKEWTT